MPMIFIISISKLTKIGPVKKRGRHILTVYLLDSNLYITAIHYSLFTLINLKVGRYRNRLTGIARAGTFPLTFSHKLINRLQRIL